MTTGRINQITIVQRSQRGRSLARSLDLSIPNIVIVLRAKQARGLVRPRDWCFRGLQPTRSPLVKCRWEAQVQFRSKILRCQLTSSWAYAQGRSRIGALVDIHTLVTHNDTIIFCSLREGLTYSHCAQHAETVCHKKDCCVRGSGLIISNHSFTFLFTVTDSVLH